MTKASLERAFDRWNAALMTQDPDRVAALYAPDALLIPTVSNILRDTPAAIRDYFVHFLSKAPIARLHKTFARAIGGDHAVLSGVYLFNLTKEAGSADIPARFTFVYRREGDDWLIVEHHSSFMPERGAF
jgi:uncharacterized protein (TIGR02246 family)